MPTERTLDPPSTIRFEKHRRAWKLMENDTLIALVLYKKGAREIKRRLDLVHSNQRAGQNT